ncbi:O-antigen ligase family protein [Campylobacter suis]|uniref:O-antigen ligase-related domain-containing protein n=1 Tax=Campylobacter suis TaxID=2790657 RepID=A0ABN7K2Z4_9BACT|nr:O-antigen ligase family protein [Campylobacter suis]CAD7286827.1 hypothetical protein LMG8286_00557 [Campylobacter suis]
MNIQNFKKHLTYDNIFTALLFIFSLTLYIGKSYNIVSALIVLAFMFKTYKARQFFVFKDKFFIFMSLWCAYMLLSMIWATHKDDIPKSVGVLFLWVLLYLAIKTELNSTQKLERFFKLQIYVVLFIAFNAILQLSLGYNIFGTKLTIGRATDLFSSADRIYPYILPLFVGMFGAMLTLKNRPKSHYILYTLGLFGIFLAVPASGIRGPLIILAIFIPIIAWANPYRKTALGAFGFLILCLAALLYTNPALQNRVKTLKNPFENQKHLRVAIWKTAFEQFKDNPMLGVGYKNFRHRQFEYYKPEFKSREIDPKKNKTAHHSHSPWLDILAEQGVVGLCFLIVLFFGVLKNAYKKGAFMFISLFSVMYAFSFLHSTFVLSSSRWSFFMIYAVTIYALLSKYHKISVQNEQKT